MNKVSTRHQSKEIMAWRCIGRKERLVTVKWSDEKQDVGFYHGQNRRIFYTEVGITN